MKIYFVRHGESEFNAANKHQHSQVELSQQGKEQVAIVAKRFLRIPIDVILTSTSTRAYKTANIIAAAIERKIIQTSLLTEIKQPSEIVGFSIDDPEAIRVRALIKEHWNEASWHYSDEENFFDAKARAQKFLPMLAERKEENILAVTHGVFLTGGARKVLTGRKVLKMVLTLMAAGEKLTPELFLGVRDFFVHRNTGITLCEYDERGWRLITWNDHAHLG